MANNDAKKSFETMNLTVVALVALVAIVGVTAMVLNGRGESTNRLPVELSLPESDTVGSGVQFPVGTFQSTGECGGTGSSCDANADCCSKRCRGWQSGNGFCENSGGTGTS